MKKILVTFLVGIISFTGIAQNVGIGTTTPNASAQLDVSSTNSGFLPPRMTYAQRNAIVSPAAGLIVYCTDCSAGAGEMNYFNGNTWMNMTISTASNVVANLPSVTICNQIWTNKNLDVSTYRNGDPIPKISDSASWVTLTTGAYCYYNNDSATYAAVYGKLYNWYAVKDPRGLAPQGWHIPSDGEWNKLAKCIDPAADTTLINTQSTTAGGAMKEIGLSHWISPNGGATNSTGFTGLPGGLRNYFGQFDYVGYFAYWWSNTEGSATQSWSRILNSSYGNILKVNSYRPSGYYVRCIKD